jgi:anion-transporting  ArsA/GET3 family ATPase
MGSMGLGGSGGPDLFAKADEMKKIIEEVGQIFRNPVCLVCAWQKKKAGLKWTVTPEQDKTTFVCVLTAEFLPLYETERLVQELAKMQIDTHNIIVNQLIDPAQGNPRRFSRQGWLIRCGRSLGVADACSVCKTRLAMQRKYLTQIEDLYLDFNITKVVRALWGASVNFSLGHTHA